MPGLQLRRALSQSTFASALLQVGDFMPASASSAPAAGVSSPALFQHFVRLADLYASAFDLAVGRALDELADSYGSTREDFEPALDLTESGFAGFVWDSGIEQAAACVDLGAMAVPGLLGTAVAVRNDGAIARHRPHTSSAERD